MDLLNTLFYKIDNETGQIRLSKTKVITWIVFIIFFIIAINLYYTSPQFANDDKILLLLSSIVFGLVFAVPTFVIGWLISKFMYRGTSTTITSDNDFVKLNNPCPYDNAIRFKKAIEENNSDLAGELLSNWNVDDANYRYASIIYEGMPPTDLSLDDLNKMFMNAEKMKSCDESLRLWYQSTAIQVINLNK